MLIKLAGKLPKEVAAIFHDLVANGMEKGYAARKAWGMVRKEGIEVTPVVKKIIKPVAIQGQLFDSEEFKIIKANKRWSKK